ncbi:MAG: class I SAM-dependent methyltransferase [Steroidobacteraceae bacterium]
MNADLPALPDAIVFSGHDYRLRYPIPKIWTQRTSRAFGIYWADDIAHGMLYPQPTAAELRSFYDVPTYDAYLDGTRTGGAIPTTFVEKLLVKIAYHSQRKDEDVVARIMVERGPAPSVCDIGCGAGMFLDAMRAAGACHVAGVDPSPVSREALRLKGITCYEGTGETLDDALGTRKFDVITMFHSLEHTLHPAKALANLRAHLNPGGVAVIEVPNMGCIGAKLYFPAWYHTDAGRHTQFFTTKSLQQHCRAAGFVHTDMAYSGFISQFTPDWINGMGEVWDNTYAHANGPFPRPSKAMTAFYMPLAALAPSALKYECMRVYARE